MAAVKFCSTKCLLCLQKFNILQQQATKHLDSKVKYFARIGEQYLDSMVK